MSGSKKKNSKLIPIVIAALILIIGIVIAGRTGRTPEVPETDLPTVTDDGSFTADDGGTDDLPTVAANSEDADAEEDEFSDYYGVEVSGESTYELEYTFANEKLLDQHYKKHGIEMGFDSPEDYEQAASDVVNDPDALHKTEAEDGDDIYYLTATNEFVVVSTYGYIRTYFLPDDGMAYYERQ